MRIVFVGAGSIAFTRTLISDLAALPALHGATLVLHDLDAERLAVAEGVARMLSSAAGADFTVEPTLDRRRALAGADVVMVTIHIGGHEQIVRDFEVPARYRLRQTVGDTLGIGGIVRAARTIPAILDICRDMAELCPQAWLLNYTNPMAAICSAVHERFPQQRVVGLCHSTHYTVEKLARLVNRPVAEVSFTAAGVNHQSFILTFEHDGEDCYPLLDEAIGRDPELARTVRVELYRRLGYFVTESSEHSVEYVPWFLRHDELIERFRVQVDEKLRDNELARKERAELDALLAARALRPDPPSGEYAPLVIDSLATGSRRLIYGNVQNTGLIENLPQGACVEVPCLLDEHGVRPLHVGRLPAQLAALNTTYLAPVGLAVRGVLDGEPDHFRHAAMLDPNTAATLTLDAIWALCDELLPGAPTPVPAPAGAVR